MRSGERDLLRLALGEVERGEEVDSICPLLAIAETAMGGAIEVDETGAKYCPLLDNGTATNGRTPEDI